MLKIAHEMDPIATKTVANRDERSNRTLDAVRELAPKSAPRRTRSRRDGGCRCVSWSRCSGRACFGWRCREHGADLSWTFFHSCE